MKITKKRFLGVGIAIIMITGLLNFNPEYWEELGPIYLKSIFGKLPDESDSIKLPPLPNPFVNNNSVLGVDVDKNGIRDDLDHWIAHTGLDYNERMAGREVLKLGQELLNRGIHGDRKGFQETMRELWLADGCQRFISSSIRLERRELILSFRDLIRNTKNRRDTYSRITKHGYSYEPPFHIGSVGSEEIYLYCKFDIQDIGKVKKDREKNARLLRRESAVGKN